MGSMHRCLSLLCMVQLISRSLQADFEACDFWDGTKCSIYGQTSTGIYTETIGVDFGYLDKADGTKNMTIIILNQGASAITITAFGIGQVALYGGYNAFSVYTQTNLTIPAGAGSYRQVQLNCEPLKALSQLTSSFTQTSSFEINGYLNINYAVGNVAKESQIKLVARVTSRTLTVKNSAGTTAASYFTRTEGFSSPSISIGSADRDAEVLSFNVTISSLGDLTLSNMTVDHADFSFQSLPTFSIDRTSATFTMLFNPSATGYVVGVLNIQSNTYDTTNSEFTVRPNLYIGIAATGTNAQIQVQISNASDSNQLAVIGYRDFTPTTSKLTFVGSRDISFAAMSMNLVISNIGSTELLFLAYDATLSCTASTTPMQLGAKNEVNGCNSTGAFSLETSQLPTANAPLSTTSTKLVVLRFQPKTVGYHSAYVSIHSKDFEQSYFTFLVAGNGTDPEIAVYYRGSLGDIPITAGDFNPSLADGTNFGGLDKRAPALTHTFVIKNEGTATLQFSQQLGLSGFVNNAGYASFAHFSLNQTLVPSSLAPMQEALFFVTFAPIANSTAQPLANVTIVSMDRDEPVFSFSFSGEVTDAEIDIVIGSTNLGNVDYDATLSFPVTIYNRGSTVLYLSGGDYGVFISPTTPAFLTITSLPLEINPGQDFAFPVDLNPKAVSRGFSYATSHTFQLSIVSNDFLNPTVTYNITWMGVDPDFRLTTPSGTLVIQSNTYQLGAFDIDTANAIDFTLSNRGYSSLLLTNITVSGGSSFSSSQSNLTVAAQGTGSLRLLFSPVDLVSTFSATVSFSVNDFQFAPSYRFSFGVSGTGQDINLEVSRFTDSGLVSYASGDAIATSTRLDESPIFEFNITSAGTSNLVVYGMDCSDSKFVAVVSPALTSATTLSFGQSINITITFTPTVVGASLSECTMTSNDPTTQQNGFKFAFDWEVLGPEILLQRVADSRGGSYTNEVPDGSTPSTASFLNLGGINTHSTYTTTFKISNAGNDALFVSSVYLVGNSTFNLTCASCVNETLASTDVDGLTFDVSFSPTVDGEESTTTVHIINDDYNEGSYEFSLRGVGTSPALSVYGGVALNVSISDGVVVSTTDDGTDLGSAQINDQTVTSTFSLHNSGSGVLTIASVTVASGDKFSISTMPSSTVASGETTTFVVSAAPTQVGAANDTITITSDDPTSPTFDFIVSVTGINRGLNATTLTTFTSNAPDDFGSVNVGNSVTHTYTLTNSGSTAVTIEGVTLGTSSKADVVYGAFSLVDLTGSSIAGGGSLDFDVIFDATTFGTYSAKVSVTTDDYNAGEIVFYITASASGPEIDVSPEVIDFGPTVVGEAGGSIKTLQVFNLGTQTLSISAIYIHNDLFAEFSFQSSCNQTLASDESCNITCAFVPVSRGAKTAMLTIVSDDFDEPVLNVTFLATSSEADISLQAALFGEAQLGISYSSLLPIENVGDSSLTLMTINITRPDPNLAMEILLEQNDPIFTDLVELGAPQVAACVTVHNVTQNGRYFVFDATEMSRFYTTWTGTTVSMWNNRTGQTGSVLLESISSTKGQGRFSADSVHGDGAAGDFMLWDYICPVGRVGTGLECLKIDLADSFGDGWSGNSMNITTCSNVTLALGITMQVNTTYESRVVCVPYSNGYRVKVNGGTWQSELSWTVTSQAATIVGAGADVVDSCPGVQFRITNEQFGILQASFNHSSFGDVCSTSFNQTSAAAACYDSGFASGSFAATSPSGEGFSAGEIVCPQNAISLDDCTITPSSTCTSSNAVFVNCTDSFVLPNFVILGSSYYASRQYWGNSEEIATTIVVAPHNMTAIPVTYKCRTNGTFVALVTVTSNDPQNHTVTSTAAVVGVDRKLTLASGSGNATLQNNTLSFTAQARAGLQSVTLRIFNNGSTPLTVHNVTQVSSTGNWTLSQLDHATIAGGRYTSVTFSFLPTRASSTLWNVGQFSSVLAIYSDDLLNPVVSLQVAVNVINPSLTRVRGQGNIILNNDINPSTTDGTNFGAGQINLANVKQRTFFILSEGQTSLILSSPFVNITGAHASSFSVTTMPASPIAAGSSASFVVSFSPTSLGVKTAQVNIYHNTYLSPVFSFAVSGNGTDRVLELSTGSTVITEGSSYDLLVDLGVGIVLTQFTISNQGTTEFQIAGLRLDTDLSTCEALLYDCVVNNQTCTSTSYGSTTLFPGQNVTFTIRFDPESVATCPATLRIQYTDDSDDQVFDVQLNGAGFGPDIQVQWTGSAGRNFVTNQGGPFLLGTADLTAGQATGSVGLYNVGRDGSVLQVSSVMSNASNFVLASHAANISNGQSATIQVTFTPSKLGSEYAMITVISNDYNEPTFRFTIEAISTDSALEVRRVSGTKVVKDSNIALGEWDIKAGALDLALNVVSVGNTVVTVYSTSITGSVGGSAATSEFVVSFTNGAISPQNSSRLVLSIDPTKVGNYTGTLTINSNDFDEPAFVFQVSLTAIDVDMHVMSSTGIPINATSTTPVAGQFTYMGDFNIVNGTATKTFVISNSGTTALVLKSIVWLVGAAPTYDPESFRILSQPSATILPGSSSSFDVMFDPVTVGQKKIQIAIESNDWDQSSFLFLLAGSGWVDGVQQKPITEDKNANNGEASPAFIVGVVLGCAGGLFGCHLMYKSSQNRSLKKKAQQRRRASVAV